MKQILSEVKVLPVLEIERNVDPEKLIGSLIDGNITVVEITLRNEMGFKHIEQIRKKFPEIKVGVGTVLNIQQLTHSIDCGAQFAVSPGYELDLALKAKELKKLKSAGCDIVLPRSSLVKNIPKLLGELIS